MSNEQRISVSCERQPDASWNAYVAQHADGTLWHQSQWANLIREHTGHRPFYFQARDHRGQLCGVLPIIEQRSWLFGRFLGSVPYFNYGGILADHAAARDALMQAACNLAWEKRVRHLEFRHQAQAGSKLTPRSEKLTVLLDLPADAQTLWSALGSKLRAQIRRPSKAGATARVGGLELLDEFYQVFAVNMRDLGVPVYPKAFFQMVFQGAPQARIALVELQGEAVAAGVIIADRDRMEIPWASSLRSHNRLSVNMLMYWAAIEHAIEQGCTQFDFGRCTRDSGTHRFKRQWGGRDVPLSWEYWYRDQSRQAPLSPDHGFGLAMALWRRLPLYVTKLLGPPLVLRLP